MARSRATAKGTTAPTGEPTTEAKDNTHAPTVHASNESRYSIIGDVWKGAVLGDFARGLHLPGAISQIAVGYFPVIGTLCSARDYIADRRSGDNIGAFLNLLGLIPIAGGFPHTAEVIHRAAFLREVTEAGKDQFERMFAHGRSAPHEPAVHAAAKREDKPARSKNELAHFSLVLGILTPLLVPVVVGVFAPILVIITGHIALARAKSLPRHEGHTAIARWALFFGYFYLVLFAAIAYLVLVVAPFGPLHQ